MSKQKPVKQQPSTARKQNVSADTGAFTYLFRNLAIIAGLGFLFLLFWNMYGKERRYNELTQEFYRLRAQNPNSPQLRDVYNEIMMLQPEIIGDTGLMARFTKGYHWAIHDMALGSLEDIKDREEQLHHMGADSTPEALVEAKRSMKIGLYDFAKMIKRNTPENAVILLPAGDSAVSNNGKWNFIYDPEWMEYFLYPRLCVAIGNEDKAPELAKRETHIVIIEGKGYDRLKYEVPVEQRARETVLPIDHPPTEPLK